MIKTSISVVFVRSILMFGVHISLLIFLNDKKILSYIAIEFLRLQKSENKKVTKR